MENWLNCVNFDTLIMLRIHKMVRDIKNWVAMSLVVIVMFRKDGSYEINKIVLMLISVFGCIEVLNFMFGSKMLNMKFMSDLLRWNW
jgi:hypothetical protein